MDWLRHSFQRFRVLFFGAALDNDLDVEMASHLEMAVEENRNHGMSPEEARRQALLKFGGSTRAREEHRESRGIPFLENTWRDLNYAIRTSARWCSPKRHPNLAVGIGANIAVFSVIGTLPTPLFNSQQLVWFSDGHVGGLSSVTYKVDSYEEFRRLNQSFQQVTAYQTVWGSSAFAVLGLVLAALGIYGVISHSVTRQTQEIGIRMALGASPQRVQWSVLSKTMRLALMGMAVGALASFAASKVIASLLFNIEASDPATFVGVLLLLLAVGLLAGYLPAFRATRINPTTALRFE
jgi:high-affinity Fe2+/Pb2+ permease